MLVPGVKHSNSVVHKYIYSFSLIGYYKIIGYFKIITKVFPNRLLQNIEYNFLYYAVSHSWLSILYIVVVVHSPSHV